MSWVGRVWRDWEELGERNEYDQNVVYVKKGVKKSKGLKH